MPNNETSFPTEKPWGVKKVEVEEISEPASCHFCKEEFDEDDLVSGPIDNAGNMVSVCGECFSEKYFNCGRCDKTTREHQGYDVNGDTWCRNCMLDHAAVCSDCNQRLPTDEMTTVSGQDGFVCESCRDEYITCDDCGSLCRETDDDGMCEHCQEQRQAARSKLIHGHSYKPKPNFYGKTKNSRGNIVANEILMGGEIEVEVSDDYDRSSVAEKLLNIDIKNLKDGVVSEVQDHLYLKHDGSLDEGFEIVTHPHNLEEQHNLWQQVTQKLPSGMKSFGTSTCGFHVHLSRNMIGPLQLGKMLVFVNKTENKKFINDIAQRTSDQWAKIYPKKLTDASKNNEARYEAINLQNRNTVEFRIFKGNLKFERIMKNFEFCHATAMFCKDASIKDEALTYEEFCKFVLSKRGLYKHLYQYLIEMKYLPKPEPKKYASAEKQKMHEESIAKFKKKRVGNA